MKGEFTEGMNFLRKFETLLPNDSCYKITLLLKNHFNSKVDLIISPYGKYNRFVYTVLFIDLMTRQVFIQTHVKRVLPCGKSREPNRSRPFYQSPPFSLGYYYLISLPHSSYGRLSIINTNL